MSTSHELTQKEILIGILDILSSFVPSGSSSDTRISNLKGKASMLKADGAVVVPTVPWPPTPKVKYAPLSAETLQGLLKHLDKPRHIRKAFGLNQAEFWALLGVTQSGGSRYESGRAMPNSVRFLLHLLVSGEISIDTLSALAESYKHLKSAD